MCTGAEIAMMGAALAGTALPMLAQDQAYNRQQKQISRGLERQSELQRQATQAVRETSKQYDPATRKEGQEAEAREQSEYLQAALDEARGDSGIGLNAPVSGKVSEDYLMRRALAEVEATKRAAENAAMLGKIAAPTRLRQNEAIGMGDLAADLAMLGSFSAGEAGVTNLKAGAAGQANPWMVGGGAALAAGAPMIGSAVGRMGAPTSPAGSFGTTRGMPIYTDPGGFTYNMPKKITPLR